MMPSEFLLVRRWATKVWQATAVGAAMLIGFSFINPDVEPVPPRGVGDSDDMTKILRPTDSAREHDFVTRPLLVASRQPWLDQPNASSVIEIEDALPELISERREIKDLELLGVFASEDARGVIVKSAQGKRLRLLVGDPVNDWTLVAVEPRAAVFRDGNSEGQLTMAVASSLSSGASYPADRQAVSSDDAGDQGGQEGELGDNDEEASEPASFTPTFESMYRAKAQMRRAQQEAAREAVAQSEEGDSSSN